MSNTMSTISAKCPGRRDWPLPPFLGARNIQAGIDINTSGTRNLTAMDRAPPGFIAGRAGRGLEVAPENRHGSMDTLSARDLARDDSRAGPAATDRRCTMIEVRLPA